MKLNIKKTLTVGIPFLSIMLLWQVYNWMVPLYLNDYFNKLFSGDKMVIGIIMALDNLFALFMIPLIASISDKSKSKIGRRKPFIILGITISAVFFTLIPFVKEQFGILILLANIIIVLISMNVYRGPAVALMPDITPEPLRSKANSYINILGGIGTALGYILIVLFAKVDHKILFMLTGLIMIVCLVYVIFFLNETKLVKEYEEECLREKENCKIINEIKVINIIKNKRKSIKAKKKNQKHKKEKKNKKDDKEYKPNVILLLFAILFFFMSINAVETFMSLYSDEVFVNIIAFPLNIDPGALSIIPFGIGCFAFAYPAASFADKYGRKNVVLFGMLIVMLAYLGISIISFVYGFNYFILLLFLIGGCGYALVIINILPMVLENSNKKNTGKYTGYYYTASMIAQSITPALCGLFLSGLVFNSMIYLFPYAIVFILLSAITISFIKEKR